jgi:phage FluMu protein Com
MNLAIFWRKLDPGGREQFANALLAIYRGFELLSNKSDSSDLDHQKHDLHRISTDDGIPIPFNLRFINIYASICTNLELNSKKIVEKKCQLCKHSRQITSTEHETHMRISLAHGLIPILTSSIIPFFTASL